MVDVKARFWELCEQATRHEEAIHSVSVLLRGTAMAPLGLILCLSLAAAGQLQEQVAPTKNYPQTYEQSFRDTDVKPESWNFTNRRSEQLVRFEPAGVRIDLPAGEPMSAGIISQFRVKGDFEITLRFEMLKTPRPEDAGKSGTRFSLNVTLDTPADPAKSEAAALSRTARGLMTWARRAEAPVPLSNGFPMAETTGRLRLVRSGGELFYLVAGGDDEPFRLLTSYRFGAEDVKHLTLTSTTGGDKAMLDVRVTDFRIRADELPGAPLANQPVQAAAQPAPIAPGPGNSRMGLLAALAVGLVLCVAFVVWVVVRKRRSASGPASAPAATISFACPSCAKPLKIRADLIGKRVKCSQCSAAITVPISESGVAS